MSNNSSDLPYVVGENYFIRTVTSFFTGKLKAVYEKELVLISCSWIADTGRFANAMKDFDVLSEIEPFPAGEILIGRGAIIDAHITKCELPAQQK